ncbi:hypothetical protein SHKM778_41600 [Streptomyces sp. KM77-8]|uniref:Uncharacterized protein n=1 Tax=Streptomyces haneummycinicus TaxID=3074435 RepID=A0AAT9HK23_9ACTN
MDEGGDHPLVDGRGGVFLGDGDAVGCPFGADPLLHRRDDVEQQDLLPASRVETGQYGVDGVVLTALEHRLPEPVAEHGGRRRVPLTRPSRRAAR